LVAEFAELADHSGGACLPRLFGNCWTVFLVTDSLVQDQPDQATLSMGNGPNDLVMSQARGDFFVGTLAEKSIRRVNIRNGNWTEQQILLRELDMRIRDVRTAPDGNIYALTDTDNGQVLRLSPR
jgi:hypothetical protein